MSIGSWLLILFTGVAFVYLWAWLPQPLRTSLSARPRLPERWNRDLSAWRLRLAAAGFPLSIGVGIYTASCSGRSSRAPSGNTNLVAQMFLFSALSTGCAVLIIALSVSPKSLNGDQLRFLHTLDVCLIVLELFIVLPYVLHGELSVRAVRESSELVLGRPFTFALWVVFLAMGLLTPLALEIWELAPSVVSERAIHHNRKLAAATAALVVAGGYTLRYVFVYAGQASTFR